MSELKLEVGNKYNISFRTANLDNAIGVEFVKEFNGGIVLFDNNGYPLMANKEFDIISEYTEPEKLSGFVVILKTYESHTVRDDNKELLDSSFGLDNIAACINLSQFNVGEGLNEK